MCNQKDLSPLILFNMPFLAAHAKSINWDLNSSREAERKTVILKYKLINTVMDFHMH